MIRDIVPFSYTSFLSFENRIIDSCIISALMVRIT